MRFAMSTLITIHRITIIVISARCVFAKRSVVRSMFLRFTRSASSARVRRFSSYRKWGFQFQRGLNDYGAGFVLGNAEIRLVDLAGAYAGLARKGMAMRPKLIMSEHFPIKPIASPEGD